MLYVIHPHGQPAKAYTAEELTQNAREQKAAGIPAHYRKIYDFTRKEYSRPGYLVYSTIRDGAAVVVLDETGNAVQILTGPQGDFIFTLEEEEKTV